MYASQTLRQAMARRSFLAPSFNRYTMAPAMTSLPRRYFDLHEYHSKKLMGTFGINVQKGELARSADEAFEVASKLNNKSGLVVKAQVQAGGRGKGTLTSGMKGGVHVVDTPDVVKEKTKGMIGYNLITH